MGVRSPAMEWSWVPELETAILGPRVRPGESLEIAAGAALLNQPSGRELRDHVATRLVDRLSRFAGASRPTAQDPFYRLSLTERVLLSLLHRAKWTYTEIGALMGLSGEQVEELAWMTRLELARTAGPAALSSVHPRGSPLRRMDCPEYLPARPWTQRWIEGAYGGTEKLFLQQHLERCEGCREAAITARKIFFAAEANLPQASDTLLRASALERAFLQTRYLERPQEQKLSEAFGEALVSLFQKREVWGVVVLGALIAWFF